MNLQRRVLALFLFLGFAGPSVAASQTASEVQSIPEPSALLLAGLCGVFFLVWRRK